MLDKFRETAITWDKATRRIYSPITANASDSNGRKLNIQVVNSGQVENLTGATLHLYWETKDKTQHGLDAFTASDISKGEFELFYTTGMLSNVGELNATLVLVDATGQVVSDWFKITVARGIDNDAIQSENSFTSLTQALIDISNLEQNYAPRLNDLTAQLQETGQRLDLKIDTTAAELNGRVDETIANAGDGTIPTELTDIRVIRNRTFDVAGSAVRSLATGVSVYKESSGENLYSPSSDTIKNKLIGTDGVVATANDWTMAKIPVRPNKKYDIWFPTGDYSGRIGGIAFVDKDMNVLNYYTKPLTVGYVYNGVTTRQFTSPDLATHILVNVARPDWQSNPYNVINTFRLFNGDPNKPQLIDLYGLAVYDKLAHDRINSLESGGGYEDIKMTVIGDSNTENNSRATVNYVNLIEEKMGFDVVNLGVSGTGFKRGDNETNAYYQRVSQIPLDTKVLLIDGSLNDLGAGVPLGNWNDETSDTIAGAINMTLDAINSRLPIVSMGICAPLPWNTSDPSWSENEATKYAVLLQDICKRRGIPYLDMYFGSGLRPWSTPFREAVYKRDGGNGVHPDEDGHRIYIYPKKREFIKTLI